MGVAYAVEDLEGVVVAALLKFILGLGVFEREGGFWRFDRS